MPAGTSMSDINVCECACFVKGFFYINTPISMWMDPRCISSIFGCGFKGLTGDGADDCWTGQLFNLAHADCRGQNNAAHGGHLPYSIAVRHMPFGTTRHGNCPPCIVLTSFMVV